MNKSARKTLADDVIKRFGNLPSPATYSPMRKYKVEGSYEFKDSPRGSLTDILYLSSVTPDTQNGIDLNLIKTRSPNYSHKSKLPRIPKFERNNSPSPASYKPNNEVTSINFRSPRLILSKEPRNSFLDRLIKEKR